MCTSFSSSVSYIGGGDNLTRYYLRIRLTGSDTVLYNCYYKEFTLISNTANITTNAGNGTNIVTINNPRLLDVFHLNFEVNIDFPQLEYTPRYAPLVNSLIFYIISCSEDQVTDYSDQSYIFLKQLPLYSCAKDIVYFKRYKPYLRWDEDGIRVNFDLSVRLNKHLIIKPGHCLKACFVIVGKRAPADTFVSSARDAYIYGVSNLKYRNIF